MIYSQVANVDATTGLNFFNPVNETLFDVGDGLAQAVLEAHAAYHAIGNSLHSFEIGNEVNGEWPSQPQASEALLTHSSSMAWWPSSTGELDTPGLRQPVERLRKRHQQELDGV